MDRFEADEYAPDVAWHALHFLLTGSDWDGEWPLSFLVEGGTAVGDVDVGYGPAVAFSPVEVAEVSSSVASVTEEMIASRFSVKALSDAHIYPMMWSDERAEASKAWLLGEFQQLKAFMERATLLGCGVVRYIG